ncbi:hypothetical protein VNI00_013417 [Paramarasmius palmivorus]|uniref:Terpene synthase n=1 Tax=Paramarasmius palmivorus TaxID=297713 RepID=A0AAW0C0T5_9AGAR
MSTALDVSLFPECFTSFPVRLHKDERLLAARCNTLVEEFSHLLPDYQPPSLSAGPHGVVYALCFPEGEIRRLMLCAEFTESAWFYDEAVLLHAAVKQMFVQGSQRANGPDLDVAPKKWLSLISIFQHTAARMIDVDPKGAPWLLERHVQYWSEYDSTKGSYDRIEDYIRYRNLNIGYWTMSNSMQWCLDIYLSDEEMRLSQDFDTSSTRVLTLTNDYWSWSREKGQVSDRALNGIPVVMKQYSMSEADAKIFVKGMIVEAEQRTRALGLELKKHSDVLRRYVEGIFLILGGNALWSSTCPRYNEVAE